jgi:predicted helicase
VFIDTDEDAEVALDSSVFDSVWDVVNALRAHDTVLGEQLDELRREMGRKGRRSGNQKLPSKFDVDVPTSVGGDFINALKVKLVNTITASWEFMFGLLQKYVDRNGTALVRKDFIDEGGDRLGQ